MIYVGINGILTHKILVLHALNHLLKALLGIIGFLFLQGYLFFFLLSHRFLFVEGKENREKYFWWNWKIVKGKYKLILFNNNNNKMFNKIESKLEKMLLHLLIMFLQSNLLQIMSRLKFDLNRQKKNDFICNYFQFSSTSEFIINLILVIQN